MKPANLGSSVGVTKVHDAGRARRGRGARPPTTTSGSWSSRASTGARSRWRCSATASRGRRSPARSCRATSSTTTRTSTSTAPASCWCRRPLDEAATAEVRDARLRGVPGAALRRARPRRLLLRGGRPRLPPQRGQHDARVHAGVDVPAAVGGVRASPTPTSSTSSCGWRSSATNGAAGSPPSAESARPHLPTAAFDARNVAASARSAAIPVLSRSGPPTRGSSSPWGHSCADVLSPTSSCSARPPWRSLSRSLAPAPGAGDRRGRGRTCRSRPTSRNDHPARQVADEIDLTTVVPALQEAFGERYGGFWIEPGRNRDVHARRHRGCHAPTTPPSSPS